MPSSVSYRHNNRNPEEIQRQVLTAIFRFKEGFGAQYFSYESPWKSSYIIVLKLNKIENKISIEVNNEYAKSTLVLEGLEKRLAKPKKCSFLQRFVVEETCIYL